MTHHDTLQIPRAVVEQALEAMEKFATLPGVGHIGWNGITAIKTLRAALQPQAAEPKLYRLMCKDGTAWVPASEWITEIHASWLRLVEESPETWRINEPLDGKKVADAFVKALQPQTAAEPVADAPDLPEPVGVVLGFEDASGMAMVDHASEGGPTLEEKQCVYSGDQMEQRWFQGFLAGKSRSATPNSECIGWQMAPILMGKEPT